MSYQDKHEIKFNISLLLLSTDKLFNAISPSAIKLLLRKYLITKNDHHKTSFPSTVKGILLSRKLYQFILNKQNLKFWKIGSKGVWMNGRQPQLEAQAPRPGLFLRSSLSSCFNYLRPRAITSVGRKSFSRAWSLFLSQRWPSAHLSPFQLSWRKGRTRSFSIIYF